MKHWISHMFLEQVMHLNCDGISRSLSPLVTTLGTWRLEKLWRSILGHPEMWWMPEKNMHVRRLKFKWRHILSLKNRYGGQTTATGPTTVACTHTCKNLLKLSCLIYLASMLLWSLVRLWWSLCSPIQCKNLSKTINMHVTPETNQKPVSGVRPISYTT